MIKLSKPHGFTLIFVLWAVIALMIMGTTLSFHFRTNRKSLQQLKQTLIYKQYVKNGLLLTMAKIKQDTNLYDHPSERDPEDTIIYQNQQLINTLTIEDVGSLINVNVHPSEWIERIPDINGKTLSSIQKIHNQDMFVSHLSEIDPQYRTKAWSRYLTTYGDPSLNLSKPKQIARFLAYKNVSQEDIQKVTASLSDLLNEQRNSDIEKNQSSFRQTFELDDIASTQNEKLINLSQKYLKTKSIININTAPEEVLNIVLPFLGFSSSEIQTLLSLREERPIVHLKELEDTGQLTLSQEALKALEKHLSFRTSFYKIISTLQTADRTTTLLRTEAVVHKTFLSEEEAQLRVICWVTVTYD